MSSIVGKLTFTCERCGNDDFQSRNKLFKHIKTCNPNTMSTSINTPTLALIPSSTSCHESNLPAISINDPRLMKLNSTISKLNDVKIHIVGGRLRGRTLKSTEIFSFKSFSWQISSSMLENRGSHGAVSIASTVYVIGGGGLKSNLATCEQYDTLTNTWQHLTATMSSYRHALAVVCDYERYIYAVGGWEDGSRCSTFIERYDVIYQQWFKLAPILTPRRLIGAAILRNRIYTFGGISESSPSDGHHDDMNDDMKDHHIQAQLSKDWFSDVVEYYDIVANTWHSCKGLPYADACSAISTYKNAGDVFVFIHGRGCYKYNIDSDSYEYRGLLPIKDWFNFSVTTFYDYIFLHGGVSNGTYLKVLYAYDTLSNVWIELPSMLRQRRRCAAAIIIT